MKRRLESLFDVFLAYKKEYFYKRIKEYDRPVKLIEFIQDQLIVIYLPIRLINKRFVYCGSKLHVYCHLPYRGEILKISDLFASNTAMANFACKIAGPHDGYVASRQIPKREIFMYIYYELKN